MDQIPRYLEPQHVDGCIAVAVHATDGWFGSVYGGAAAHLVPAFVRKVSPSSILPGAWENGREQWHSGFPFTVETVRI